jgi:hypothetical protein
MTKPHRIMDVGGEIAGVSGHRLGRGRKVSPAQNNCIIDEKSNEAYRNDIGSI